VAVAEAVAAARTGVTSPLLAVSNRVVDTTPRPVKEWAIATFGDADKAVLLTTVVAAVAVVLAVLGVLGVRRPRLAVAILLRRRGRTDAPTARSPGPRTGVSTPDPGRNAPFPATYRDRATIRATPMSPSAPNRYTGARLLLRQRRPASHHGAGDQVCALSLAAVARAYGVGHRVHHG
jgi:hypothetical protein